MDVHQLESKPHCPACRSLIDGATCCTSQRGPESGDFTVCVPCGAFLRFTQDMQLKVCDEDDMKEVKQYGMIEELHEIRNMVVSQTKYFRELRSRAN